MIKSSLFELLFLNKFQKSWVFLKLKLKSWLKLDWLQVYLEVETLVNVFRVLFNFVRRILTFPKVPEQIVSRHLMLQVIHLQTTGESEAVIEIPEDWSFTLDTWTAP